MTRQGSGRETWHRLLEWDQGQAPSERLSAQVLISEGFKDIDPTHPLGGRDSGKDIICTKDSKKYVCASYFPRGKQSFAVIKKKFISDYSGVKKEVASGFCFITNQEIKLNEREKLKDLIDQTITLELFHLERLATILNKPNCLGIRLDFLEIEMTREEQISFIADRDSLIEEMLENQRILSKKFDDLINFDSIDQLADSIPIDKVKQFRSILNEISGQSLLSNSYYFQGHVNKLHIPLNEIKEFQRILDKITGSSFNTTGLNGNIHSLCVPIDNLNEYELKLNRIIAKLREMKSLEK